MNTIISKNNQRGRQTIDTSCIVSWSLLFLFLSGNTTNSTSIASIIRIEDKTLPYPVSFTGSSSSCSHPKNTPPSLPLKTAAARKTYCFYILSHFPVVLIPVLALQHHHRNYHCKYNQSAR